jgi:hypothetical protein
MYVSGDTTALGGEVPLTNVQFVHCSSYVEFFPSFVEFFDFFLLYFLLLRSWRTSLPRWKSPPMIQTL